MGAQIGALVYSLCKEVEMNFYFRSKNICAMKCKKHAVCLTVFILLSFGMFFVPENGFCGSDDEKRLKYVISIEKNIPEEVVDKSFPYYYPNVVAFDRMHENNKNAIAVAGKNIYIFNQKGSLVYKAPIGFISKWTTEIRYLKMGNFSREGYYDTLVVAQGLCGPSFRIYDRFGIFIGIIDNRHSYDNIALNVRDINGDGIDEIITDGKAFSTHDGGMTWGLLWRNREVPYRMGEKEGRHFFDVADADFEDDGQKGVAGVYYDPPNASYLVLLDAKGNVIFKNVMESREFPYFYKVSAIDSEGSGFKNKVLLINDVKAAAYIFDVSGKMIRTFRIDKDIYDKIDYTMNIGSVKTGQLNKADKNEEIVIGGAEGIVAYDSNGEVLWKYLVHDDSDYAVPNLFITDVDCDGQNEIVASVGSKILVLSNEGNFLDMIATTGRICRWTMMDVADIDGDGYKEIIAVTTAGKLQVFKIAR